MVAIYRLIEKNSFDSISWPSHSKSWNCPSTSQVVYRTTQVFTNLPSVFKLWVHQKWELVPNQYVMPNGSGPGSLAVEYVVFFTLTVCSQVRLLYAEICEKLQATLWVTVECFVLNELYEAQRVDNLHSATAYTFQTDDSRGTSSSTRLAVEGLNDLTRELYSFGAKCLLVVIQIPKVLAWLDYLKWKFKLFSTGWWSVENDRRVIPERDKKVVSPIMSTTEKGDKSILKKIDGLYVLLKLTVGIRVTKMLAGTSVILTLYLFIDIQFRVPRIIIMLLKENMLLIEKIEVVQPRGDQLFGIPDMRNISFSGAIVVQKNNREGSMAFGILFSANLWGRKKNGGTV